MSETKIKVPNIGDFKDVEVIEVLVSEGQMINKNDPLSGYYTSSHDSYHTGTPYQIENMVSLGIFLQIRYDQ